MSFACVADVVCRRRAGLQNWSFIRRRAVMRAYLRDRHTPWVLLLCLREGRKIPFTRHHKCVWLCAVSAPLRRVNT